MHMDDDELGQTDYTSSLGIARSKSFTGILSNHHQKRPSFSASFNGSGTSTGSLQSTLSRNTAAPWTPVLGQSHRGSSGSLRSLGMSLAKLPKMPRPARTNIIFDAITRGLNECVSVTEEDISTLKGSVEGLSVNSQQSQGKLYELEKQLKVAERYLKRLEYHLAKLEELQDHYILQQKLKDGVRNMAHAFILSPGRERESALSNVRSGFKECMESLCCVEAQLEQMMGTLQFEMKGVQGFARLCAGDAFEICVRHGHQKWKSRGRVLKNKMQTWDSQGIIFKALLSEVLHIKAVEVKGLTKTVLLGIKYCDTKDLFCANPQIMTVNLNSSGSLKLSIIITWNPLDGIREDLLRSQLVPNKSNGSPMLKDRSSPRSRSHGSLSSQTSPQGYYDGCSSNGDGNCSPDVDSRSFSSGHSSVSVRSATVSPPGMDFTDRPTLCDAVPSKGIICRQATDCGVSRFPLKSSSLDSMHLHLNTNLNGGNGDVTYRRSRDVTEMYIVKEDTKHNPSPPSPPMLHNADSLDCCSVGLGSTSQESHLDSALSLPEIVHTVASSLEDIQGCYPELYGLELQIIELELLVRRRARRGSHSSDISSSIESALECFDFLNTEEVDEDENDFIQDKIGDDEKPLDPELTAKTTDSGIASIARKLRCLSSSSPNDSGTERSITGSDQLDLALCTHLNQCLRLLENLGTFGPLKCRETRALRKLKAQTTVIARLQKLVKLLMNDKGYSVSGADELTEDTPLQQLWSYVADRRGEPFCVSAEQCFHRLSAKCEQRLKWKQSGVSNHLVAKVARLLVTRILDSSRFDGETLITVHQFSDYFWRNVSVSLDRHFEELADEMNLLEVLRSSNVDGILDVLIRFSDSTDLPPPDCLRAVVALVICGNRQLQQASIKYLLRLGNDSLLRGSLVAILFEGLESDDFVIRQASVATLKCLEATDCIELLAYVFQTDENVTVRNEAKSALVSFGAEGRKAYEQGQLSSLGFQGLRIN